MDQSFLTLTDAEIDERFVLRSRAEIVATLRQLATDRALISIDADRARDFVLTTILDVDAEGDALVVEGGPDAAANRRLLGAESLFAVTEQGHVKVRFVIGPPRRVDYDGRPAFSVPLPASLVRLQRREFFRATAPVGRPLIARIPIVGDDPTSIVEFRVLDISVGGLGLLSQPPHVGLIPGTVIPAFRLQLPEIGAIECKLEVPSSFEMRLSTGVRANRSGCKFLDLPARMGALVQRYINKLQAEQRRRA
ncbi:MAG: flagellar brake protein [Burkholderiales bacterium]|nr:flagellar brake protein [Burkholderiales bacterium]